MKLNTKYKARETGQEFYLHSITDRKRKMTSKGPQMVKIEPILTFRYTNRKQKDFTCYKEHVLRSLDFGAWEEIK